jgi:hypothetical protein
MNEKQMNENQDKTQTETKVAMDLPQEVLGVSKKADMLSELGKTDTKGEATLTGEAGLKAAASQAVSREPVNPDAALMPDSPSLDAPAVQVAVPVKEEPPVYVKHITIDAVEFDHQRGSLTFTVWVHVLGKESQSQSMTIAQHNFRGYFDGIWKDMGKKFKEVVG